jgi:heme/copper-type cytochrome/quinol oxidase subunit 3
MVLCYYWVEFIYYYSIVLFFFYFIFFICLWFSELFFESFIYLSIIMYYSFIMSFKYLILSELMVFMGCFWTMLNSKLTSWIYYYLVLFINTCYSIPFSELIVLLYSSLSNSASFIFIFISFYYGFIMSLYHIILSAFSFIYIWLMELMYSVYCIYDDYFDCIFLFTISIHGLHVLLGFLGFMVWLCMEYMDNGMGVSMDGSIGYYILTYYWHFVDMVWVCVYVVYLE